METEQIVYALLIFSHIIILICCLIMIIKYDRTDTEEKVWIASKIKTLKSEMLINNYNLYPIISISSEGNITEYKKNYNYLLNHSKNKVCEENYKKCGILDTCGNIMCIPNEGECPVNEIIVDSESKYNDYLSQGYQKAFLKNLKEGYSIYYTNTKIDNKIIVKIKFSEEIPRYINEDNFIFDYKLFKSLEHHEGGGVGVSGGGLRNLEKYGDSETTNYIFKKIFEDENIDKSYKKVFNNLYVGNYIGFADINNLNDYDDIDLYDSYITVFPNEMAYSFCYVSMIAFVLLIIFSLLRVFRPHDFDSSKILWLKAVTIILYLPIFIGYFVYILYEYHYIYKERNPENLLKVKADEFIENFLLDIYNKHFGEGLILAMIILFSCSMFIFLFAWIISIIFKDGYFDVFRSSGTTISRFRF